MEPGEAAQVLKTVVEAKGDSIKTLFQLRQQEVEYLQRLPTPAMGLPEARRQLLAYVRH